MVEKNSSNTDELLLPLVGKIHRRQDVNPVYSITTVVYATTIDHILKANSVLDGNVGCVDIPPERAADIDTAIDFKWVEFLMRNGHDG